MNVQQLSKSEQDLVMYAIRQFGTGGHQFPDEQNIGSFTPQYASTCLRQALKRAILDARERGIIEGIVSKLRQ